MKIAVRNVNSLVVRAEVIEMVEALQGAYAPALGPEWHESQREDHVASSGLKFSFITYRK